MSLQFSHFLSHRLTMQLRTSSLAKKESGILQDRGTIDYTVDSSAMITGAWSERVVPGTMLTYPPLRMAELLT